MYAELLELLNLPQLEQHICVPPLFYALIYSFRQNAARIRFLDPINPDQWTSCRCKVMAGHLSPPPLGLRIRLMPIF